MPKNEDRMLIAVDKYINGMYIELLPKYSWLQALRDAKYTEKYAHGHCSEIFKRAKPFIDKKLEELAVNFEYTLEWIDQQFRDLYAECRTKGDRVNATRVLEGLTKRKAGFTDVIQGKEDTKPALTPEEQARLNIIANEYMKRKA